MKKNGKWGSKYRDRLPDSAFLLPKHRKLPYKDAQGRVSLSHVRNALARANQVEGVPKRDVDAAVRKAERILLEHGGYENRMQPNFFRSKPKTPAQIEEERIERMRDSQEWKDFYRGISSDYAMRGAKPPPAEERKEMADAEYERYHAARRRRAETGIARNPRRRAGRRKMRRNSSSSLELFAQPYSPEGKGFYFSSADEYEKKYAAQYAKDRIEEYEIQFIEGDPLEMSLFNAMGVSQANLEEFFDGSDTLESMDDGQKAAVIFLMEDRMMNIDDAMDKSEEVMLFEGSLADAAEDYFDNIGEIPQDTANMYFDYDAFGRDLSISGDDVASTVEQIEELQESGDEDDAAEAESLQEWVDNIENMTDQERGEEFVNSLGGVEELGEAAVARYFDFEAFGRDASLNGDWDTFSFEGTDYVILNAAEF